VRYYAIADRWLRAAIEWCSARDLDANHGYSRAWLARSQFEQGHWSQAGADAASVMTDPQAITRIVSLTVLGRLRQRRGDPDAASPLARAWELAEQTGDLQRLWPVAAARAEEAWLQGRPSEVEPLVEELFAEAMRLAHAWAIGELGYWLWRSGAINTAPPGAATPYARQIDGDWVAAAAEWDAIGCPYESATALAESDRPEQLLASLETFNRLGARPAADLVGQRLRQLGVDRLPRRPRRSTVDNPGGLTDRELEVLELLTKGLSNAEIAARLFISVKTAAHHVSAILAKFGVRSRLQAASIGRDWGAAAAQRASAERERG
jgi:DNA-binding CsgD family transcriptional regulator